MLQLGFLSPRARVTVKGSAAFCPPPSFLRYGAQLSAKVKPQQVPEEVQEDGPLRVAAAISSRPRASAWMLGGLSK